VRRAKRLDVEVFLDSLESAMGIFFKQNTIQLFRLFLVNHNIFRRKISALPINGLSISIRLFGK
jgi:hypothetical protein